MQNRGKEREKQVIKQEEEEEDREQKEIDQLLLSIMECYKDSVIPPLSDFSPLPKTNINEMNTSSSRKRGRRNQASDTESYLKEHVRRGKMAEKFSVLQSMVPSLYIFPKATKETIVTDTIEYIKQLEQEKERLEGQKKSLFTMSLPAAKPVLSHCANSSSSVEVSFSSGAAAFFGIQIDFQRSLVVKIFMVFEKYHAQVLAANVLVDDHRRLMVTVTALLGGDGCGSVEMIKREILSL